MPKRIGLIAISAHQLWDVDTVTPLLIELKKIGIECIFSLEETLGSSSIQAKEGDPLVPHRYQICYSDSLGLGAKLKIAIPFAMYQRVDVLIVWQSSQTPKLSTLQTMAAAFEDESIAAIILGSSKTASAYKVSELTHIPFEYNTDEDHFEYELFLQFKARDSRVKLINTDQSHFFQKCRHFSLTHTFRCLGSYLRYRANRVALIYHPKFDFLSDLDRYLFKKEPTSLHQYVLKIPVHRNEKVVDLGAGNGQIIESWHAAGANTLAVDRSKPSHTFPFPYLEANLNTDFSELILSQFGHSDKVIMLDVIEHLAKPEVAIREIWKIMKPGGTLILSTANVAFLPIRLMLLCGIFNYGRRGILDLTHSRLFTLRSLQRLLIDFKFKPYKQMGFGPPIADLISRRIPFLFLDRILAFLAKLIPSLFGYQILIMATRNEGWSDFKGAVHQPVTQNEAHRSEKC